MDTMTLGLMQEHFRNPILNSVLDKNKNILKAICQQGVIRAALCCDEEEMIQQELRC